MSPTRIAVGATALSVAVLLGGCSFIGDKISEAAGEKISEKIVEGATGGDVDINIDEEGEEFSFSIDSDDGSTAFQSGSFVEGWPTNLVYPTDYLIISSIKTTDDDGVGYMSMLATAEDYESVVASLRSAYESDSDFNMESEPTVVNLGEMQSTALSFTGREFDLHLMVTHNDDSEYPTGVQYFISQH